jgi:hypothetical protein
MVSSLDEHVFVPIKARRMREVIEEGADSFVAEGKHEIAAQMRSAMLGSPDETLARLYDILAADRIR